MGLKTVAGLAAVLWLTACKSTGSHEGGGSTTRPAEVEGDNPDDPAKVPMALWSPAQRRATASYYFMAAEFVTLKDHDARKALQLYEAAYSLDPNPFLGGKTLAARAAAGERGEAMLDARKMVLLYPRDPQLRFFYGDMLVQEGQLDEASLQLEKCVELDAHYEAAYLELADLYQNTKQSPKAIVVAKELVRNVPASVAGWSQLSRLYLISGQYKEALLPARRAWEMQSANPQLTQIYAIVLQLNGKIKQAVRIYEQLYRMDPTDEELTGRMVELYREIGNLDSAIELLDEMIKQGGQAKPAVEMQKAILLWELKRNDEAAKLLDQLVKDYPDSDRVRYLAAFGHERMEQFEKALMLYRGIAANSPLRKDADFRELLILAKDKAHAQEAYELGKKLLANPQATWEAYGVISGVYADTGHYDDALAAADAGYKKFPDKPRLLFLKGVYQEKLGDREGCIATMRQAIKADPDNSSAYNYLGYLFAEKAENLDEAEKLISQALTLKPNDGFYLDSLGWVHYQKGDYAKAQSLLEQAVKIEPKEGVIYEHLGDVKKALGDKASAHSLYKQALQGNLEDADRARIETKVKEGA